MTIKIKKCTTGDTRYCDVSKVSRKELLQATMQHINDVEKLMHFMSQNIKYCSTKHDETKLTEIDQFYADFQTGFKQTSWWDMHRKTERHHINSPDGVRDDVDIVDLIEHICDCVAAGLARSGSVFPIELPNELLQKIVKNTVDKLVAQCEVIE